MKFGSVLRACALSAALLVSVSAQTGSPDDLYLQAYESIQEAEQLMKTGQHDRARDRYLQAETKLKKLKSSHPSYNPKAVDFRLEFVAERVKGLPAGKSPAEPPSGVVTLPALLPQDDAKKLLEHIKALQAENAVLGAKLQEAMAPKPASVDPTEFAKAQERIQQLEKEKELLRVRADQAQAKQPQAADLAMLEQTRSELAATKQQLVENVASVATLTQERNQLQKDKADLEAKLAAAPAVKPQSDNSKVKDLEKERDSLLKRLNDANKELYDVKARGQAAQFETLTNQLSNLRARLEVYEARKVPFTKEEMALMDKNVPALTTKVDPKANKSSTRDLPAGAGLIVAEAERLFAQRRYVEAEEKYKQVLKMDEKNALSLANLAAIQLEMQKIDEADANLKKAIEIAPQDPYILSLIGMLRFQQGKYDEALNALSRSAQLDPKNAETQNYLGITLSQQGQREGAETALRKAVTLNPNYAGAHHNLAVVYATQKPPFLELARYHYNKALALGQAGNPDLEKQLAK